MRTGKHEVSLHEALAEIFGQAPKLVSILQSRMLKAECFLKTCTEEQVKRTISLEEPGLKQT